MRKFIYAFLGTISILFLAYTVLIAIIDPFYVFHMPGRGMKVIKTDKAHYVARGLIRNADYDMLICGSSMCENFHIDDANEIFYEGEERCLKVVQHGSYSNDLRASLEAAARAKKAKVIIMALDTSIFQKPEEGYRSDMPHYTTEEISFFNIWPYLLSKDVFRYALDLVLQNVRGNVPSQDSWWIVSGDEYSEENLLSAYKSDILDKGFRNFNKEKARNNLKNIEKGVEACQRQGIEIKFFIPPYSVAEWDCCDYKEELMEYKELWKELLEYSNVSIYAIQFNQDIIMNFDNYRNVNHYSESVCHEILCDISEGRYQLSAFNIDNEVERFISLLDTYDWITLRKSVQAEYEDD